MKNDFRKLRSDELQIRPTDTGRKGKATLLLYKDARVDMNILDETFGKMGWRKDYKEVCGNLFCGVSVKDQETGEWITKWDCGSESNIDAEKGQASDAFKRACFNWGIGRELYTTPVIRIDCPDHYYGQSGKMTMKFYVREISYDGDRISSLAISDARGDTVYTYGNTCLRTMPVDDCTDESEESVPVNRHLERLVDFCNRVKNDENVESLRKFYKFYENKDDLRSPEAAWNKWWANENKNCKVA